MFWKHQNRRLYEKGEKTENEEAIYSIERK